MKSKLFVIVFICYVYIYYTDAQNIVIDGDNPVEALGGKGVVLSCKVISGIAEGENPNLEWFDKNGNKVTGSGRISSLPVSLRQLKLLINDVQEDDSGNYNCTGVINGKPESAHVKVLTKMPLEVTEEQAPRIQWKTEGEDAQIKCAPQGDVTVNWKDRDGNFVTSTHDRYVVSNVGYMLIPKINRTDDGVYQCVVVADTEFLYIDIQVIVAVPPKIVRPPTGQSVSVGEAARFECVATAKPEPLYRWYKDDGAVELGGERYNISVNTGVFIIKSVIKDDKASYKCKAFSRNQFDEKSAILNVLVPPSIVQFNNATGDEGTSATLSCTAYGEPIPEIKWQKKGSDTDFTDGTQQDNNNIVVSHQQRPDRMEVESTLEISNLVYSNAGFYICKATNEAKTVEKSAYLAVQYKPNFSKVKEDVLYSWGGQSTQIACIASSVPPADITWSKEGRQINTGDQYYSIDTITIGEDTTSTLTVNVDFSNEGTVFGIYTCKGFNTIGESTKNFTLQRADPPSMPSANLKTRTPISVVFEVNIPKAFNGPRVYEIEIAYAGSQPKQYPVAASQSKLEVTIDGLTPNTDYSFNLYAINEVGKSAPFNLPLRTLAARKPYEIIINSRQDGDKPLEFQLQWNSPNNGGYPVTDIFVRYAQVEIRPDKSPSGQYQREKYISGWLPTQTLKGDATSYKITGLSPTTYYEVEVTAKNREGTSDPKGFIFRTSTVQSSGYIGFAQGLLPSKLVLTISTVIWACLGILL